MARFHLNNDNEPGRCNAQSLATCPFKSNPHFETMREAEDASSKILEESLATISTMYVKPDSFEEFYNEVVPYPLKMEGVRQQALLDEAKASKRGLTPDELDEHLAYAEKITTLLKSRGGETNSFLAVNGVYLPERRNQQQALIKSFLEVSENVPRERKALLGGGMGGAGKTSAIKVFKVANPDDYVSINPDDFKELMAERGMVPKVPGLLPMEASTLVHEEASDLSKDLLKVSLKEGKNVFLDKTVAGLPGTIRDIQTVKNAGYSLEGFFVDIPPEVSAERARSRYEISTSDYLRFGMGQGGRPIPGSFAKSQSDATGRFHSKNAANFNRLASTLGIFNTPPRIFDNSVKGRPPEEISVEALEIL